jgi:hypothetical protein
MKEEKQREEEKGKHTLISFERDSWGSSSRMLT